MPSPVVAHVLSSLRMGGAEHNIVRLAAGLQARGFKQLVISLSEHIDRDLAAGLCVPLLHPPRARRVPWSAAYVAGAVRAHGVDIIHGTNFSTWTDCVAARTMLGRRVRLVQCIQGPATFEQQRWRQRLTVFALRAATAAMVGVSPDIARRLQRCWGVLPERVHVIGNIVDVGRFRPPRDRAAVRRDLGLQEAGFVIGSVGSLYELKNHQLLIRALAEIQRRRPDAIVVLIGDGPLRGPLQRLAAELGVADRVRLLGRRNDVHAWLQAMDVYVHPSRHEGSPLAVLEAMATALPTVAAPSSGCRDLHETCGLPVLIDADNPHRLAELLTQLAGAAPRRAALGRAARQAAVRLCGPEQTVGRYATLFSELSEGCSAALPGEIGVATAACGDCAAACHGRH